VPYALNAGENIPLAERGLATTGVGSRFAGAAANPSIIARWSARVGNSFRQFRVLAILAVIASLSMSFSFRIIPITPNLDPSFVYSFNYAAAHGLKWGREFISTYGPYGYLIATMDLGHLVRAKILFGLFLAAGTGIAVAAYVRSGARPGAGRACRSP
jgi:hypothetical protein